MCSVAAVFFFIYQGKIFQVKKTDDQSYVLKSVNDLKEINMKNQTGHEAFYSFGSCFSIVGTSPLEDRHFQKLDHLRRY